MFYSPRNRGNMDRFYRFRSRSISAAQAPRFALVTSAQSLTPCTSLTISSRTSGVRSQTGTICATACSGATSRPKHRVRVRREVVDCRRQRYEVFRELTDIRDGSSKQKDGLRLYSVMRVHSLWPNCGRGHRSDGSGPGLVYDPNGITEMGKKGMARDRGRRRRRGSQREGTA